MLQAAHGAYYAGDRIAVYGENCCELVATFAAGLGLEGGALDDMFMLQKIQQVKQQGVA
jgi:hypothetical protein